MYVDLCQVANLEIFPGDINLYDASSAYDLICTALARYSRDYTVRAI